MTRYQKDPDAIARLSPEAFRVTQQNGTERPFSGIFDKHNAAGLYVDIVSGEPLFTSLDKFESGCGWPSFSRPARPEPEAAGNVTERGDVSLGMARTEVRSTHGDSHLGHVFNDGPAERGGLRYCINSASLRFVPAAELAAQGYEPYLHLFDIKENDP